MNPDSKNENDGFKSMSLDIAKLCERFLRHVTPLLEKSPPARDGADQALQLMSFSFLPEQISNLKALLLLYQGGPLKSIGIVGRSMLEGMVQLKWASAEPSRPERWRHYAAVLDWNLIEAKKQAGESVDANYEAEMKAMIKKYSDFFIVKREKRSAFLETNEGLKGSDLAKSWYHPESIRTMFEEIGDGKAYRLYQEESQRTHWNVGAFGRYIDNAPGSISYRIGSSGKDAARAMIMGAVASVETTRLANAALELGAQELVEEANDSLEKLLSS